jgi:hypothetical protein
MEPLTVPFLRLTSQNADGLLKTLLHLTTNSPVCLFSGRPAKDVMDEAGISMEEFKDAFQKGNLFASGVVVDYGASIIVAKDGDAAEQGDGTDVSQKQKALRVIGHQELATNIKIGMRMPSFQVLNQVRIHSSLTSLQ